MLNKDVTNQNILNDGHVTENNVFYISKKYQYIPCCLQNISDNDGPSYGDPFDYHSYISYSSHCSS